MMDFVSGLSKTGRRHDSIWVIVDRLTKSAHFLSVRVTYKLDKLAEVYVRKIVCLYRVPKSITPIKIVNLPLSFGKAFKTL